MTATKTLGLITWVSFLVGLVTVSIAYLAVTFGGGGTSRVISPPAFQKAMTIGTSLMYIGLLIMPALPLMYHQQNKNLNGWDWATASSQWLAYLLLPIALKLWDSPKTSKTGAITLGISVASLITSVVLSKQAYKKRGDKKKGIY